MIIFIENWSLWGALAGDWSAMSASSVGASFFAQRRARNASDWWRNARDHGEAKEERWSTTNPFSLSRPPSRASFHRERERRLGTRQGRCSVEIDCGTGLCIRDLWPCSFLRNHAIANKTSIHSHGLASSRSKAKVSKEVRERSYLIC